MNPQSDSQASESAVNEAPEPTESDLPVDIKDIPAVDLNEIDNSDEKKQLIFTIQKYQDSLRFGKIVKFELGFKESFTELSAKSDMDLENILYRIRQHLDNKHLDKFYENMATTLAITYEQALSIIYPIYGFSDMLLENDDFWNCYERYRIESQFPSINPVTQMLFMIGQFTLIAHHTEETVSQSMDPPPAIDDVLSAIEEDPRVEEKEPEKTEQIQPIQLGQLL